MRIFNPILIRHNNLIRHDNMTRVRSPRLLLFACLVLPFFGQANTIYKCHREDKIVFSQTACPAEYKQHKIEYQLGVTTETDSDKPEVKADPLQALLNNQRLSKDKLLQLLDSEVYRLKQENNYFQILRASELQKLERNRYWQQKGKQDADYLSEVQNINTRFDGLTQTNLGLIQQLSIRKEQLLADAAPDTTGGIPAKTPR